MSYSNEFLIYINIYLSIYIYISIYIYNAYLKELKNHFLNYETDDLALVDTGMYDDLKEPEASKIYNYLLLTSPRFCCCRFFIIHAQFLNLYR